MSSHQRQAYEDFCAIEAHCILHGSLVYGFASAESDVDVHVPDLDRLFDALSNNSGVNAHTNCFELETDLRHLQIARLILRHTPTQVTVDVVGIEHYHKEKDIVMKRVCSNPLLRDFLSLLRNWFKHLNLSPAAGYPNTFNMLLLGLFFLQVRAELPPWAVLADVSQPLPRCPLPQVDGRDLFGNFLGFLMHTAAYTVMDLHLGQEQPKDVVFGGFGLALYDPVSGRDVFLNLSENLTRELFGLAQPALAQMGTNFQRISDRW
jgi:hypothetical protein